MACSSSSSDAQNPGTGGVTVGGAGSFTGGAGQLGGTTNTGGAVSYGGATSSGGAISYGGAITSGGMTSSGGTVSSGGAMSSGGRMSSGGATSSGGQNSSGGTPGQLPYKGVANSPASEIEQLGASWCYNWMSRPQSTDCDDPLFVPMVWDGSNVAATIQQIANDGYTTVLGFNEPNKSDQANMTVAQAIALWPEMTSVPGLRVSSPAVSDDGRAWLEDFMTQVEANGLRVDFIAMHWYGWNAGSCTASQLQGAVNWAEQWDLPVWITEFGCMGSSNPDEQTLLDFFPAAITMLGNHPQVERYAWYPWNTYNDLFLPDENDVRVITPLGELFATEPSYR